MPIDRLKNYSKLMEDITETKNVSETAENKDVKELTEIKEIKEKVENIEKRNERVEIEKAWETSTFRKVAIAVMTYCLVALFFWVAELPKPFISAIIPTLGFVISTLSFPFFKDYWLKHKFDRHRHYKRKNK